MGSPTKGAFNTVVVDYCVCRVILQFFMPNRQRCDLRSSCRQQWHAIGLRRQDSARKESRWESVLIRQTIHVERSSRLLSTVLEPSWISQNFENF